MGNFQIEGVIITKVLPKDSDSYSKVTMEAQMGLIGGTMGLLTGFSILSGVEIVYYLMRFLLLTLLTSYSAGFSCPSTPADLRLWLLLTKDLKII